MKTTAQDPKRTKSLLQHKGVRLHDIQSFSFMKRFREVPRKSNLKVKDKYGAGILTLHLKQGSQKAFYVRRTYLLIILSRGNGQRRKFRRLPMSARHSICFISLCFSSRS